MIAYSKLYWIHDLGGREFHFGTRQVASVTQSFVWHKLYYTVKMMQKTSDKDIRRGVETDSLTSLGGALYTFSTGY